MPISPDLDRLEQLANSATPGTREVYDHDQGFKVLRLGERRLALSNLFPNAADAELVAALDPQTVLALIEEVRELRDRMRRHHAYLSGLTGEPCRICRHEGMAP